jgi:hypothetical protein
MCWCSVNMAAIEKKTIEELEVREITVTFVF